MHNCSLTRKSRLKRRTPLARGKTRIPARSAKKAVEDREYTKRRRAYLEAHPLCQATIFEFGLDEADVVDAYRQLVSRCAIEGYAVESYTYGGRRLHIPIASEIHHRNKSNGPRRNDERFWLSVCREMHDRIETNLAWARGRGLLLPINADRDGVAGGIRYPTTPELLAAAADKAENTPPADF